MEATSEKQLSLRQRLSRLLMDFSSHIQTDEDHSGALVQIWMPEKTADGKTVLQASSLPFSVLGVGDLQALFRCVSVRYRFGTDINQPQLMGAIGRVFASMAPEFSNDLQRSDKRLYLRATEAQRCRVNATLVVPIFDPSLSRKPVAIFELSQNDKNCPFADMISTLDRCLEPLQLHSHTLLSSPGLHTSQPLPGSWHEPKLLDGSPETSGESNERGLNSCSNGYLVRELMPAIASSDSSARDPMTRGFAGGVIQIPSQPPSQPPSQIPSQPPFDLTRRSMDGMRHQIAIPTQPASRSNSGAQQQQQQTQALSRPPMVQQGLRPPGGLSVSLAAYDPSTSRLQMPPLPTMPMSQMNGSVETEASQQAKQLVEWMAANNVSTDALKTILLSKSPGDNQSKKKRVHESQESISYQTLMQAQAAVDAGSNSGAKAVVAAPMTMPQPVNPLVVNPPHQERQVHVGSYGANGGARKSDGGDHDDLGSDDDDEEEEDPKAGGGGHGKSNYQGAKLSYEDLQGQFGKGIKDAAKALGICTTTLKRACRRHGITRWPRRQIAKLNKALAQIGYQGDASVDLFESAVKGKAGVTNKPSARPKSSTAAPLESLAAPSFHAHGQNSFQPPGMMESLLMQQSHQGHFFPPQQQDPSLAFNQMGYAQAFSSGVFSGQPASWGQTQQPSYNGYVNYQPQPQQQPRPSQAPPSTSVGQPQASSDVLNLAMEMFAGDVPDDVSFGSLLNDDEMKGIAFN